MYNIKCIETIRNGEGVFMVSNVLVHVTRGNIVESLHRGDLAIVDFEGKLRFSVGSPREKITFIRSSSKPIQALPILESGAADHFGLCEDELAIFCASHSGEPGHIDTVRSILQKIGLTEDSLQCGTHWSSHKPTAEAMLLAGQTPQSIHCNCSGKHSGMLTLAQYHGWDVSNYTELSHPVQQSMLQSMALFAGISPEKISVGIDGCGVPVFGLSVYHMALSFAKLANPELLPSRTQRAVKRITTAMMNHPFNVAGTGRLCTVLMTVGRGKVFAKSGAEAVYCVGIPELGLGLAVKIEDGGSRAVAPTVIEALKQIGALSSEQLQALKTLHEPTNYNHRKEIIGETKAVFTLEQHN